MNIQLIHDVKAIKKQVIFTYIINVYIIELYECKLLDDVNVN